MTTKLLRARAIARAQTTGYLAMKRLRMVDGTPWAEWRDQCFAEHRATIAISEGRRWSWLLIDVSTIDADLHFYENATALRDALQDVLEYFCDEMKRSIPGHYLEVFDRATMEIQGLRHADAHWIAGRFVDVSRRYVDSRRAHTRVAA